jgi:hypothetical protein
MKRATIQRVYDKENLIVRKVFLLARALKSPSPGVAASRAKHVQFFHQRSSRSGPPASLWPVSINCLASLYLASNTPTFPFFFAPGSSSGLGPTAHASTESNS